MSSRCRSEPLDSEQAGGLKNMRSSALSVIKYYFCTSKGKTREESNQMSPIAPAMSCGAAAPAALPVLICSQQLVCP